MLLDYHFSKLPSCSGERAGARKRPPFETPTNVGETSVRRAVQKREANQRVPIQGSAATPKNSLPDGPPPRRRLNLIRALSVCEGYRVY